MKNTNLIPVVEMKEPPDEVVNKLNKTLKNWIAGNVIETHWGMFEPDDDSAEGEKSFFDSLNELKNKLDSLYDVQFAIFNNAIDNTAADDLASEKEHLQEDIDTIAEKFSKEIWCNYTAQNANVYMTVINAAFTRREQIIKAMADIKESCRSYTAYLEHDPKVRDILLNISDEAVFNIAKGNIEEKEFLYNMFKRSDKWVEDLRAIRVKVPKVYGKEQEEQVDYLVKVLLFKDTRSKLHNYYKLFEADIKAYEREHDVKSPKLNYSNVHVQYLHLEDESILYDIIRFFETLDYKERDAKYRDSLDKISKLLDPNFVRYKKPGSSKIFREFSNKLGICDQNGNLYDQQRYSILSDLFSMAGKEETVYVSINPGHMLTMSNPHIPEKEEYRYNKGQILTSCHALDSHYRYNGGCAGYATDRSTVMVFTATGNDRDSLSNRKTSRQLFFISKDHRDEYVIVQSRLYDTHGGTDVYSATSQMYLQLVINTLSEIEGVSNNINDWKVNSYKDARNINDFWAGEPVNVSKDYVGYHDWSVFDEETRVALYSKNSLNENHFPVYVGGAGVCLKCGKPITADNIANDTGIICKECAEQLEYEECERQERQAQEERERQERLAWIAADIARQEEERRYHVVINILLYEGSRIRPENNEEWQISEDASINMDGVKQAIKFFSMRKNDENIVCTFYMLCGIAHALCPRYESYQDMYGLDDYFYSGNDFWKQAIDSMTNVELGELFYDFSKRAGVCRPNDADYQDAFRILFGLEEIETLFSAYERNFCKRRRCLSESRREGSVEYMIPKISQMLSIINSNSNDFYYNYKATNSLHYFTRLRGKFDGDYDTLRKVALLINPEEDYDVLFNIRTLTRERMAYESFESLARDHVVTNLDDMAMATMFYDINCKIGLYPLKHESFKCALMTLFGFEDNIIPELKRNLEELRARYNTNS